MEVYRSETQKAIKRFLRFNISFGGCVHSLDAALSSFIPRMHSEDLPALRSLMLANNEIMMKEMERRGQLESPPTDSERERWP